MKRVLIRFIALMLAASSLFIYAGCNKVADSNTPVDTTGTTTNATTTQTKPPITNPVVNDGHPKEDDIIITEVMVSNNTTNKDAFGEYSDWIEIYNSSEYELSLDKCCLSDNPDKPSKYEFPDMTIKAGEYLLIYASDKEAVAENGELHAGFKLSAGETICFSYNKTVISTLATPIDLPDDISFGLVKDDESYKSVYMTDPTPGAENGGNYAEVFAELSSSAIGIRINEFMMKNEGVFYDENGDCPDWAEIINTSDKAVDLKGFGLSDDFSDPLKWTFPDITLESGEILLVLLSGKSVEYNENSIYLHADFKLSDTDDGLWICDAKGVVIDRIDTVILPETASYGRDPSDISAWKFFTAPTPGKENGKNGFDDLDKFLEAMTQKLFISEVCAVSSSKVSALPNEDWIEIYNNTDQPVNLAGWSVSKYISNLRFYTFPDVTIAPYGYIVISASGVASQNTKSLDSGFKVSHTGNTLYLVNPDGVLVDSFQTGYQRASVTSGRVIENNTLVRYFFITSTKGKANKLYGSATSYAQPATLESDTEALIANKHVVTLETKEKNARIYYTINGSDPTDASFEYAGPLVIEASTVIKAIVYCDGKIPSDISAKTFLVEDAHSLGIVCLTCDPDDLFGYENGIWADGPGWTETYPHKGANFWKDWEREVFFEYYTPSGELGISFSAGIKNHGQYSRAQAQKSVSINLKEAYGSGTAYYPFFGDDGLAVFDNLLLRTGGQDWNYTNLIDAYCQRVVEGQMDLDYMQDLPVAVYVNGEYWGLYYIREKINESYVYYHQGIEEDDLDMIKGNNTVETGSYTAHKELLNYIKNHNLANQEYFDYVASQIDIEEWTNYWIVESYFANTDTGNIRFYKSKTDGKWRWILFDMDWALYTTTYHWNMIEEFIAPSGHGVGNMFSTTIAVGLFKNEAYKQYFIEKYAEYMNTVFRPERMIEILEQMVDEIDEEMKRQCDRWGAMTYTRWQKNIENLKTIIQKRWNYSKGDLKETFKLSDAYMAELFPEG